MPYFLPKAFVTVFLVTTVILLLSLRDPHDETWRTRAADKKRFRTARRAFLALRDMISNDNPVSLVHDIDYLERRLQKLKERTVTNDKAS